MDAYRDILDALQAQRMGLQQPSISPAEIERMLLEGQMQAERSAQTRSQPTIGPMSIWSRWARNKAADKAEQRALESLTKARESQMGLDQYQQQVSSIDEQIKAMQERLLDLADYDTKKGIDQRYAPAPKPDKPSYVDIVDPETGHKYRHIANPDGTPGQRVGMVDMADARGSGGKDYASVGAEAKVKIGLIENTANLFNRAIPVLFDNGKFRNAQALVPKSEVRIALDDLREGLQSMLRAVSGAAIPDTEIEREVDSMMPSATDTDAQARAKIDRAYGKVQSLWEAMTEGVALPESLQIGERPQWDSQELQKQPQGTGSMSDEEAFDAWRRDRGLL